MPINITGLKAVINESRNEWGRKTNATLDKIADEAVTEADVAPLITSADAGVLAAANEYTDEVMTTVIANPIDAATANNVTNGPLTTVALAGAVAAGVELQKATSPALSGIPLPLNVNGKYGFNASSHNDSNIWTMADGTIYCVWVAGVQPETGVSTHQYVGKKLPGKAWTYFDLRGLAGTPLAAQDADGHNTFVVALDSLGYIWITGNMHGDALRMVRSTNPYDITAWTTVVNVVNPVDEARVTYPNIYPDLNGDLFFFHRQGSTDDSKWVLDKLTDVAGHGWSRQAIVLDGTVDGIGPYARQIAVERAGSPHPNRFHLFWNWRNGGAATNRDICYAYSDDQGVTWKKMSNGSTYSLPIINATGEHVFETVDYYSGLVNQGKTDVDIYGHPHIAFTLYDTISAPHDGPMQYMHLWHDGTAWQSKRVTNYTYRMDVNVSLLDKRLALPGVVCSAQGRTYIIGRRRYDNGKNRIMLIDVTDSDNPTEFPITDVSVGEWAPSYDSGYMRRENKLRLLATPFADSLGPSDLYIGSDNWASQWGLIVTVDFDQIEHVAAGSVKRPNFKTIARTQTSADTTVVATVATDSAALGRLVIPGDLEPDAQVVVRWWCRSKIVNSGQTGSYGLKSDIPQGGGALEIVGTLPFTYTTQALIQQTPYVLLAGQPNVKGGIVFLRGLNSHSSGMTFSGLEIEAAILDYDTP